MSSTAQATERKAQPDNITSIRRNELSRLYNARNNAHWREIDMKRIGRSLLHIDLARDIAIRRKNKIRALACFLTLEETISEPGNKIIARANNIKAEAELLRTSDKLYEAELSKQRLSKMSALSLLALLSLGLSALLIINRIRFANRQKISDAKLELAANLHDDLGPLLHYVRMLIYKHNTTGKPDMNVCAEIEQNLGIAIESLRNISQQLSHQEMFGLSLLADEIKKRFNKLDQHLGIFGHLYYEINSKERIPEFKYNHLLRIVNELINNSLKHASPNHLYIYIQAVPGCRQVLLTYYDDGPGWPEISELDEGNGMKNLKRRCDLIKADFTIQNNYPDGYRISIKFPL